MATLNLLTSMRYIEWNPVRTNRVVHPSQHEWSSYAHNAMGRDDPLLQEHPVYMALAEDSQQRQHAYRELFGLHIDTAEIHAIRQALNQELVLGPEDFKGRIERMTRRQSPLRPPGRPGAHESRKRNGGPPIITD